MEAREKDGLGRTEPADPRTRRAGHAPLLIVGPALGAPASMWDPVASLLVPDFRVQAFEHSGHAGAPAASGRFSMADLADGVAEIIESSSAGRACYAGDSISGAIGLELGRRHPQLVAGIATLCSVARRAGDPSMAPMAAEVRVSGTESRASDVRERWFAQATKEQHAGAIDEVERTMAGADDKTYARYLEALDAHDIGDYVGEVDVPVLAIWSEFDIGDAEAKGRLIAEGVPDGKLVRIGGAGQLPPYEQPGQVAAALRDFFGSKVTCIRRLRLVWLRPTHVVLDNDHSHCDF